MLLKASDELLPYLVLFFPAGDRAQGAEAVFGEFTDGRIIRKYLFLNVRREKKRVHDLVEACFLMLPMFGEDGWLFVHGGFDPYKPLFSQDQYDLSGSRKLPAEAWNAHQRGEAFIIDGFQEVYVGHTRTQVYGSQAR